jgi:predicted metal-dependent phosphoesterase TrpH
MPAGQPFTQLCEQARGRAPRSVADLHVHSTASDGRYTPAQVVELAWRTGLAAVALTDHDTLAGYPAAAASAPAGLEVIPAVELSADDGGREVHLLGYFVRPDEPGLTAALGRLARERAERFHDMLGRLRTCGVRLPEAGLPTVAAALGRRHLAVWMVEAGIVGSVREAFNRYLESGRPAFVPKVLLPLADAIRLVRDAGGVSSYAHPPGDLGELALARLRAMGLDAVEAEYPAFKASRTKALRAAAGRLRLLVTGGSDCHGPDEPKRAVGCRTVTAVELAALRERAAMNWAVPAVTGPDHVAEHTSGGRPDERTDRRTRRHRADVPG